MSLKIIRLIYSIYASQHRSSFFATLLLAASLISFPAFAQEANDVEIRLLAIYRDIGQTKLDAALVKTDALLSKYPNFRLGHLIRGDLLIARSKPISKMGSPVSTTKGSEEKLADLREEASVRLKAIREKPPVNAIPRYFVKLRDDQKMALVVDARRSRVYVYEHNAGKLRFVNDYYMTQGKQGAFKSKEGDQKTPVGVYHITSRMAKSQLPAFYGAGALPINYPNDWDRIQGRTGHGIWLHGTPPDTYSRAPKASDGCVVLTNADLETLFKSVQIGTTPVVIVDNVEWLNNDDELQKERGQIETVLETWRRDWESLDSNKYLAHYSPRFSSDDSNNLAQWSKRKREVNTGKKWIKVALTQTTILRYPGKAEMVEVRFSQNYQSDNLQGQSQKVQYWMREKDTWKIIYEGTA